MVMQIVTVVNLVPFHSAKKLQVLHGCLLYRQLRLDRL